jgi:hypothetical protein
MSGMTPSNTRAPSKTEEPSLAACVRGPMKPGIALVPRAVEPGPGLRMPGHAILPRPMSVSAVALEQDDFSSIHHPALSVCSSMIFSENRFPLFGIML